jgi:hypothetical protein
MRVSLEESFVAVIAYANGLPTRLPRTEAGISALRSASEAGMVKLKHADGRRSEDVDWDEVGRAVEEYHQNHGSWKGDE